MVDTLKQSLSDKEISNFLWENYIEKKRLLDGECVSASLLIQYVPTDIGENLKFKLLKSFQENLI